MSNQKTLPPRACQPGPTSTVPFVTRSKPDDTVPSGLNGQQEPQGLQLKGQVGSLPRDSEGFL